MLYSQLDLRLVLAAFIILPFSKSLCSVEGMIFIKEANSSLFPSSDSANSCEMKRDEFSLSFTEANLERVEMSSFLSSPFLPKMLIHNKVDELFCGDVKTSTLFDFFLNEFNFFVFMKEKIFTLIKTIPAL